MLTGLDEVSERVFSRVHVDAQALHHVIPPAYRKVDVRLPGKGNSKLPWREAGPLNHHDDVVDSDQ